MIGQTISRYNIIEKLGEGGMGEVYLAEDSELHRKVALKFLPEHFSKDPAVNTRFKHEVKAAAALNHSNIITIYNIGEHDGKPFIAMEYLPGKSLKDLLEKEELSFDRIIDMTVQICSGLNEAHHHGITHRDIKPDNILIDAKCQVKIADFGLAKSRGQTKVTDTGSTLGTINYMSPEQLRGSGVDQRADIWSLGVMLYEMITGHLPFSGDYKEAISYSILHDIPEPLARYKSGVSDGWQRIIDKALDKDIETRYQNIADLLVDIQREKAKSTDIPQVTSTHNRERKEDLFIWITAAVSIILIVLIARTYIFQKPEKAVGEIHQQITFSGDIYDPVLSPDGRFFAFQVKTDSAYRLFIREISGGTPLEIFTCPNIYMSEPVWSPDGSQIALMAMNNGKPANFVIPRLGGKPRVFPEFGVPRCWSPDGTHFAGYYVPSKQIHITNQMTGDTTSIPLSGEFIGFVNLDWSPDGRRFLFLTFDATKNTIWTLNSDGSNQQIVVEDSIGTFSPHWSASSDAIYYFQLQQDWESTSLKKIRINDSGESDGSPIDVQTGLEAATEHGGSFSLSSDNSRLLYLKELRYAHLWSVDHTSDTGEVRTTQLTHGTPRIAGIQISPDGKNIAMGYNGDIHVMPFEGGNPEQITFLDLPSVSPVWSPDQREIAFITIASKNKIWKTATSGGGLHQYSKTLTGMAFFLAWAPGTHIIYQKPTNRIFNALNPTTGEERQVGSEGLRFVPVYSPDGNQVAFFQNRDAGSVRADDTGIWILSLAENSERLLYRGYVSPIGWTGNGRWIYAWDMTTKPIEVFQISTSDGSVNKRFELPFNDVRSGITMTPDGEKIVCAVHDRIADAWLIENFDPHAE